MTEIARDGARRMLMAALKAKADGFAAQFSEDLLADGRQRVVLHGAGPGVANTDPVKTSAACSGRVSENQA